MRAALHLDGVPALLVLTLGACGATADSRAPEYMPDMARGPAYKAFAPNQATRDGLTLQRPVAGTIARGYHPFHYGSGEPEAIRAGQTLTNPFGATPRILEEGRGLYRIYCSVCHGVAGKGDGPLAGKIPPPAAYRSTRVLAFPPGRIFHVVTMGSGKMPSHATQLSSDERWKVVTYVTSALQGKGRDHDPQIAGGGVPPRAIGEETP